MSEGKLKSDEILERIMQEHDGQASLSLIYREYKEKWESKSRLHGKTPLNTLRGEVQKSPKFERVGIGIYALKGFARPQAPEAKTIKEKQKRHHADIQGMLLEIGNHNKTCADTYTPDKGQMFKGNIFLGSIATIKKVPDFTYPHIVDSTRYVDVLWFNEREFPMRAFEVEHSTDFRSALTKFCELQDFHVKFYCVAESAREEKFNRELDRVAFRTLKGRCQFLAYQKVERMYNNVALHKEFQEL